MKKNKKIRDSGFRSEGQGAFSYVLFLVFWLGCSGNFMVMADEIKAGVAYERIILPDHVPLAGYSARRGESSKGIHDAVGLRALVLGDADTTIVLISGDLLIVDEILFNAVHQKLRRIPSLPSNTQIVFAATHTHSGPGAYGRRFFEKLSMGHYDPEVFEILVASATRAIVHAYAHRQPVRSVYYRVRVEGLVINRIDAQGAVDDALIVWGFYPKGAEEWDQGETTYSTTQKKPLAVVVSFAAHPTTLGAWNRWMSADYPGVLTRRVEQALPGTLCIFFAGAVGDQAPVKQGVGFERAEWYGTILAGHVLTALQNPTLYPGPYTVHAAQEVWKLPPAQLRVDSWHLPRWLSRRLVDEDATLSVAQVGNIALFGLPCDMTVELGQQLKQAAASKGYQPLLIGFANDYIGYCVTESVYHSDAYEALMAFNGPKAGELIVEHLALMLDRVAVDDK